MLLPYFCPRSVLSTTAGNNQRLMKYTAETVEGSPRGRHGVCFTDATAGSHTHTYKYSTLAEAHEGNNGRMNRCFLLFLSFFFAFCSFVRVTDHSHIEDYHAALDHARLTKLGDRVDTTRIALWGTSFAGGHVLKVAAEDHAPANVGPIRAIISQVQWIYFAAP